MQTQLIEIDDRKIETTELFGRLTVVGLNVGGRDGFNEGGRDGFSVGGSDGLRLGGRDGFSEGGRDGFRVGGREGLREGGRDGFRVGGRDGFSEGGRDGLREGGRDGLREGGRDGFRRIEPRLKSDETGIRYEAVTDDSLGRSRIYTDEISINLWTKHFLRVIVCKCLIVHKRNRMQLPAAVYSSVECDKETKEDHFNYALKPVSITSVSTIVATLFRQDCGVFRILEEYNCCRMFEQEAANDVQVNNDVEMQQPPPVEMSSTDSDYYSEVEGDSPIDSEEDNSYPADQVTPTSKRFWNLSPSLQAISCVWGFPVQERWKFNARNIFLGCKVEAEQLNLFLGNKWCEKTNTMSQNRERFKSLADATAVPQLILSTIQSYFRKRQPERTAADAVSNKRFRGN
ncbi:hypothetical protein DAPPUDRAFT_110519 [Daphnia pulex]|uniref:Uncharacterized protein n=1 Tax=Daphnia pulex TaxID=6669 RepID=E9H6I0_DAPPU|nr:hypothetical protein DAPPUDRAFT_110519 [Daphnia pulex]|eukprot:EFX72662.1 hypothetical protein DAPPUDRAFT_110519 [Daphnia pulex]